MYDYKLLKIVPNATEMELAAFNLGYQMALLDMAKIDNDKLEEKLNATRKK